MDYIQLNPQINPEIENYTSETLLAALPNLKKVNYVSLGFGKVWSWQRGIIYLKNRDKIHWKAFKKNLIAFETDEGVFFYTDVRSRTLNMSEGIITQSVQTNKGVQKIQLHY
ncbi:MAG: hypothetical protein MI865_13225 [Proteobacteria bacterium]|nr:hypothetical protein [Pseudomonadota bacterium]